MSLTPFSQNQKARLPQSTSPGLVFRRGVLIHHGLDALLSHVSQHGECGLHDEVDETCSAEGNTMTMSYLEAWGVEMAGMAVTPLHVKQSNLWLKSSQ